MPENLENACNNCELLKEECLKEELKQHLDGFLLKIEERKDNRDYFYFEGVNKEKLTLCFSEKQVTIVKKEENKVAKMTINEDLLLIDQIIDKRPKGIIYTLIQKQFAPSKRFQDIVLTDLTEKRFTFTQTKIKSLTNNNFTDLYSLLLELEKVTDLKNQSDFSSEFATHMNYYYDFGGGRKAKDNIYPTKTYFNNEDVSRLFDIEGKDKLYRIFDLYNGVINSRNEKDFKSLKSGFLSSAVFNFKNSRGISQKEDSIVGSFKTKKVSDVAKETIELTLGIPYEEFELLDFAEQQKLIEQKNGKKFKYDTRLFIDGIPIDEDHLVTKEQLDQQIDERFCKDSKPGILRLFKRKKR